MKIINYVSIYLLNGIMNPLIQIICWRHIHHIHHIHHIALILVADKLFADGAYDSNDIFRFLAAMESSLALK